MIKTIQRAVLGIAILPVMLSCAKQTLELPVDETTKKVEISVLRVYMAKLIDVKPEEIEYNEKTEQFSLLGVDQISRQKLTTFYEKSIK
ncbi:hypothetical protein [Pedobacter africanus]|uniref:Uncharacterized protein n=1 Tax=Pedobacter africanus TaxID=151894 RepID=A0A1W1ZXG4_9SPHI|nr:hypothetical protein [Pedobacter africanus]SMC53110.1 hypothetical protein SAMN04488524_1054 [Pedobacter africanus]